ncbi:MAG: glycosyl hydrolase-related protein [Clostridia bacterium]|nr:glycosyl hydrolase-related protein [Clostridia bacterium]
MKEIHLINGTHWDREWRHTAEQSKLRLVDLVDNIINLLETKPQYQYFCIDGGTIVLEDYLTVRPENRQRIIDLVKAKRIFIVNWYTLPETNTVAPESLVRNLLWGHRMAEELGGGMKSGYTATSYGQPSQLPQLYQGFGITDAIFYRGTNKHVLTPLFVWEGADGSKLDTLRTFDEVTRTNWFFYVHGPAVLGKGEKDLTYTYNKEQLPVHMADMKSYEKAFTLLHEDFDYIHDTEVQKKALDRLLQQAEPYAIGQHVLALNIEDNDEPYRYLPELVEDMNKIYPGEVVIKQENFDEYMAAIKNVKGYKKAVHKGELRYTTMEYNNFNALLGATHSSRIKIKLLNDDCENNLLNIAEPLSVYASVYGKEYPRSNLNRAWESLLKCHAHDSICGAAVDRAHEDMLYNFSLAKTVAEECTNRAAMSLFGNINTKDAFKENDHTLVFYNTMPFARKEVVEIVVDTPKTSGGATDIGIGGAADCGDFYDIVDADGNKVPYVELSRDDISIGVERELDTKAIKFNAERKRILVEAEVPQNGYATYALRFRQPEFAYHPEIMDDRKLIARDGGILENEYIRAEIKSNGTFDLTDKITGRVMAGQHYFTDNGEVGSAHISAIPKRNATYTSIGGSAKITMLESNALRGSFKIELEMILPAAATVDGDDRTREMKSLPITTVLTLEKGCKYLKACTTVKNEIRDHKLVVNFPSFVKADYVDSESAWDVVSRTVRWRDHKDNFEGFVPFQPMQNFVDISDGKTGFAVFTKGLREYEIADDDRRTVKITLIRTQRAYMTANSKMNVEELDKYTGLHSFGTLTYEYALCPHQGNWADAEILAKAYENKVPLKVVQGVVTDGNLPSSGSFIAVSPEKKVMLSALKQSEDGSGVTLRLWNSTGETLPLDVSFMLPVKSVDRVKLDETFIEKTNFDGKSFSMDMLPHKIETFILKF